MKPITTKRSIDISSDIGMVNVLDANSSARGIIVENVYEFIKAFDALRDDLKRVMASTPSKNNGYGIYSNLFSIHFHNMKTPSYQLFTDEENERIGKKTTKYIIDSIDLFRRRGIKVFSDGVVNPKESKSDAEVLKILDDVKLYNYSKQEKDTLYPKIIEIVTQFPNRYDQTEYIKKDNKENILEEMKEQFNNKSNKDVTDLSTLLNYDDFSFDKLFDYYPNNDGTMVDRRDVEIITNRLEEGLYYFIAPIKIRDGKIVLEMNLYSFAYAMALPLKRSILFKAFTNFMRRFISDYKPIRSTNHLIDCMFEIYKFHLYRFFLNQHYTLRV